MLSRIFIIIFSSVIFGVHRNHHDNFCGGSILKLLPIIIIIIIFGANHINYIYIFRRFSDKIYGIVSNWFKKEKDIIIFSPKLGRINKCKN